MSFPTSPTNGQIAVVNNVAYEYASANTSWTRVLSIANVIQANVISANVLNVVQAFSITGNIATGNYFIGNGAFLTGLAATYSNANVANYLPTYTGNLVSLTGPVTTTGNITANNVLFGTGTVSGTGTVYAATVSTTGNVNSGFLSTGNASVGNLFSGGYISATGNVTGNYILGNGALLTGVITSVSNINNGTSNVTVVSSGGNVTVGVGGTGNVAVFATTGEYVTGVVSASGNITGGNLLTGGLISATGNITGGNLSGINIVGTLATASQLNITAVGTLGSLTVTANTTSGNLLTGGLISATGTVTSGNLSVTGNVIGNLLPSANVTYNLGSPTQRWNSIYLAANTIDLGSQSISATADGVTMGTGNVIGGNITTSGLLTATGNVIGGNLLTGGLISSTANVTGGNLLTGGLISATGNVTGGNLAGTNIVGTLTTASQTNITSVGTLGSLTVTANTTSGNLLTGGLISATGNITGGNLAGTNIVGTLATASQPNITSVGSLGSLTVTANATSGNLLTGGLISATGNITGNYILGNGSQLTGIDATSIQNGTSNVRIVSSGGNVAIGIGGTSNVAVFATTGEYVTGVISATGNITGGNLSGTNIVGTLTTASQTNITSVGTLGSLTVTANTTSGNLLTGGLISATGNITGGNVNTNRIVGTGLTLVSTGDLTLSATGNINANNEYINNVPTPVADGDAVNKLYVDNFVTGLNVHDAVKAATPTTLATITSGTITYYNGPGSNGTGATLSTTGTFNLIDTVNVQTAGTRILVLNEANAVTNGVYVWSNATAITRASDYNTVPEVEAGDFMFVTDGATYGNTGWIQTSSVSNIGFAGNNITFTQFSGSGTYNAGTGLTLTGTTFSVNASQTQVTSVGTLGSLSVTGNITGGNILGGANVNATTHTGTTVSVTANVTGGNLLTAGQISATGTITSNGATNGTAFAVGNSAVSNVALGMFPTAGQAGEYAIRDYSNVFTNMYLDVGMGGTANGAFQFRTSNSFRLLANVNSSGISTPFAVSATGNVTGSYFIGNGSQLTGISSGSSSNITNGTSNVTVAASGNVTVAVAGTAAVATFYTAGITANSIAATNNGGAYNFKVGDDAWLGDINTADTIGIRGQQNNANGYIVFGNADSSTKLGRAGSGPLTYDAAFSAVGNVTGGNILTAGIISATGTITSAGSLSLTGNIVDTGELWINTTANGNINLNANGTGQINIPTGILSVTGNIQGGNLRTAGLISATANVIGGNILTVGLISATSTITSAANITGGNILTGGLLSATSTITSAANITGGNILTGGLISATGNITGGNLVLSGGIVDNTGNLDLQTSAANANINLTPNGIGNVYSNANVFVNGLLSASGNITGGNITTGAGSGGNLTGANVISANTVTATANITGGNILTAGLISATGNITGGNLSGTSIVGTLTTAAQTNITSVGTLGSLTVTANVQSGNLRTTGSISASGVIITGGDHSLTGNIVDTGALWINTAANGNITLNANGTGVITFNNPITNGQANGVGNIGNSTGYFNTVFAKATSAQYADLAEMYVADADYPPGTVLEFGGNHEVTVSNTAASPLVAGVVSTNPAHLMNSTAQGKHLAAIALVGRVPTQVIGPISKGAMMVSAGNGYAQASATPAMGTVIGKAVEDFAGKSGIIEIAVGRL